jgi:hypothetical protein
MPPRTKKPRPGRIGIYRSVSTETPGKLKYLAERRADQEAALGRHSNPDLLQGSVIDELVHRAYQAERARETAGG